MKKEREKARGWQREGEGSRAGSINLNITPSLPKVLYLVQ
jgi:hypothetical protein